MLHAEPQHSLCCCVDPFILSQFHLRLWGLQSPHPGNPVHQGGARGTCDCHCHCLQAPEAKRTYWDQHCDPASAGGRNGGGHLFYLAQLLKRNAGGEGYFVGTELSVAGGYWGGVGALTRIEQNLIKPNV